MHRCHGWGCRRGCRADYGGPHGGTDEGKGIYVTGPKAGSAGMEDLIGLVDETELNAMVIDVKRR